jgi:hypothetical protein
MIIFGVILLCSYDSEQTNYALFPYDFQSLSSKWMAFFLDFLKTPLKISKWLPAVKKAVL